MPERSDHGVAAGEEMTHLGTTFRGSPLTLSVEDRRMHVYVTGKSGSGKTTLLEAMALQSISAGEGLCYIDPHGDSAERLIDRIPPHRIKDTIYVDPSDTHVVGLNFLVPVEPLYRATVSANIVELFRNVWKDSWGPRMDYLMQNAIQLLLEVPGTTLVDLHRILTDDFYRKDLLDKCGNKDIKDFWDSEFMAYTKREQREMLSPILNKVGKFRFNPILSDIVSHSTLDIKDILNTDKILVCNLSKHIGAEPAKLLGAFIANGFAQAAFDRRTMPEADRRDFTLYIDEFQNFTTESFAAIFSEARKYRLSLVAANQFLSQVPEPIRDAAIGNVATRISFRVGTTDAASIAKDFDINPQILVDLPPYHAWAALPFQTPIQFTTLPPTESTGSRQAVLNHTRARYARLRP